MKMTEYIVINIPAYKNQLIKLDTYNTNRTKSYLDLVNSSLLTLLHGDNQMMVEVDHDNKKIVDISDSIEIPSSVNILTDGSNKNHEFYQQFVSALSDAQKYGLFDEIFQKIDKK